MLFFYSIIGFIIVISICVFVHEFGHYIIAKKNGIKIDEFSIGFGRPLFEKIDKNGTKWKICDIPFGGYVKMFGDSDPSSIEKRNEKNITEEEKKYAFFSKNTFVKSMVVIGGPLFNYLFAIVLLTFIYLFYGKITYTPIITEINQECKNAVEKIKVGDKILKINKHKIQDARDIAFFFEPSKKIGYVDIILERSENDKINKVKIEKLEICTIKEKDQERKMIGIATSGLNITKKGILYSLFQSTKDIYRISYKTIYGLKNIFSNGKKGIKELGGPIKIASVSGQALSHGMYDFLFLLVFISVQLGFFNLLPIPGLDGGHLFIYLIESVFRIKIPEKMYNIVMYTGFGILISLMIVATGNDILSLFNKK